MRYGIVFLVFAVAWFATSAPASSQSGNCDGITVNTGLAAKQAKRCMKPGGGASKDQSFRDCETCPEMVVVPTGSFLMGSPNHEMGKLEGRDANGFGVKCDPREPPRIECHNKNESPLHKVSIPRPFAIGKFAVTFDEWEACIAGDGCKSGLPRDQGWGRGRRPVVRVKWDNVKDYLEWLSKRTGYTYRLPSEAEWEYAARAGTATPYWWGKTITTDLANFRGDNYRGEEPESVNRKQTLPVDAFQPNPWGLYQVHGNVWEWTEDCYNSTYENKPAELKKTGGAWKVGRCVWRVLRGCDYDSKRYECRAASRNRSRYWNGDAGFGFRVVRELP